MLPTEGVLGTGHMWGVFAQTGTDYARQHDGVGFEQFAKVAEKNHAHSTLNPLAQYQRPYSLEEIMGAEMMAYPNTLPMCCPTGDGAAAVVLVSGDEAAHARPRRPPPGGEDLGRGDDHRPVHAERAGPPRREHAHPAWRPTRPTSRPASARRTSTSSSCTTASPPPSSSTTTTCGCASRAGPATFIDRRGPWRDGEIPVNVSGGLISKGHPIGATGVANIYEVVTHLRGEAGDRQIEGAKVGLTHVIGLGSVCAVHILERSAP